MLMYKNFLFLQLWLCAIGRLFSRSVATWRAVIVPLAILQTFTAA